MRPDFITWALSKGGIYLPDKLKPTLATWQPYQIDILRYLFPAGDGQLRFSRIIWSEPKKSGKTLLAAALHLYFGLFVDVPGEQYVLANDLEGASDRTWQAIKRSLDRASQVTNPVIRDGDYRVVGTQIHLKNGTIIKALANDYKGGAGGNQSLATIDEVWGFTRPNDLGLLTEFAPVPTRENSTAFYTGYQGYENGGSNYWHTMIDTVVDNGTPIPELAHLDDGDGKPSCYALGRTFLFYSHKTRQPWHTPEYLQDQKSTTPLNEYLRVWENRRTKNSSALTSKEQWENLYDPSLRELHLDDDRVVVFGVDAATKSDCAAIVGTTWNAEKKRIDVVYVKIWTPELGTPLKLTQTIGPEIVRLDEEYHALGFGFDPFQMVAIAELCRQKDIEMIEFPQNARRIQSDTHLRELIIGNNLAHTGNPELAQHIANAVTRSNERGVRIDKEGNSQKVDAAVALSMSALLLIELLRESTKGKMSADTNPFYGN